jgi:hypothetical protein
MWLLPFEHLQSCPRILRQEDASTERRQHLSQQLSGVRVILDDQHDQVPQWLGRGLGMLPGLRSALGGSGRATTRPASWTTTRARCERGALDARMHGAAY